MEAHNGGVEAQHGAVEGLYASGQDLHHFDEAQDPDPDSLQYDRSPPDLHQLKGRIQIHINVMRIRNTAY